MYSKSLTAAAVVLAASGMVSAQTSTLCNPMEKTCPSDPAFGNNKVSCDLSKSCDAVRPVPGTTLSYGSQGAVFSITKGTDAPTTDSPSYLFYGRVDIDVQPATGNGIVTSIVLQSDDLDEIDLEWTGNDDAHVQSNYFSKGKHETYDRGAIHPVANALTKVHTYSIEWTSQAINWQVDGVTVRTLTRAGSQGGPSGFPQTPMQLKLGTWVAGLPTTAKGTVEWAGGLTDFSKAPFNAYYKNVKIVDYAGTDGPATKSIKEYVYGDKSGSSDSIQIKAGDGSSSGSDKSSSSSSSGSSSTQSSSAKASSTSSSSAEKTSSEAAQTTLTKATGNSSTASATNTASETTTHAASKPTTVKDGAATRSSMAMGTVLLAGAGAVLAQFFL